MNQHEIEIAALRSALKQAQQRNDDDLRRIAELEAEATSARHELQHYLRNTLAVIRSISRRSAADSETVEDYKDRLDGRIAAFARVQAVVSRNPGAGVDLGALIGDELVAFGISPGNGAQLEGDAVRLEPKPAGLLALVVHELALNSVQHRASAAAAKIHVRWSIDHMDPDRGLRIVWAEDGPIHVWQGETKKFGTEVLKEAISYELSGVTTIDASASGLECRISLPLEVMRAAR